MNLQNRGRKKTADNKEQIASAMKTEELQQKENNSSKEDGFRYDYDDSSDLN